MCSAAVFTFAPPSRPQPSAAPWNDLPLRSPKRRIPYRISAQTKQSCYSSRIRTGGLVESRGMDTEGLDPVRRVLRIARSRGITEVELEFGDVEFEARLGPSRPSNHHPKKQAQFQAPEAEPSDGRVPLTAPCVGFFRDTNETFRAGLEVEEGEIVAAVAALGIANDVPSPCGGVLETVAVSHGDAVQFGQVLAYIRCE